MHMRRWLHQGRRLLCLGSYGTRQLAGYFAGWLVGWLIGGLIGWWFGCQVGWWVGELVAGLVCGRLVDL